jgi:hypothetical protein
MTVVTGPTSVGEDAAAAVLTSCLGNYLSRRGRSGAHPYFGALEPNLLVGVVLRDLLDGLDGETASGFAKAELADLVDRMLDGEPDAGSANLAAYLAIAASQSGIRVRGGRRVLERMLAAGGAPEATGSAMSLAWRALAIEEAGRPTALREDLASCHVRLAQRMRSMAGSAELSEPRVASAAARIAIVVARTRPGDKLVVAAHALIEGFREHGWFDEDGPASGAPTAVLAQIALAARSFDRREEASLLERRLLEERVDPDSGLPRRGPEPTGYELSPWVAFSLVPLVKSPRPIEQLLDPPAAPLPDFSIVHPKLLSDGELSFQLRTGTSEVDRSFDARDYNLIVDVVLDRLAGIPSRDLSPRTHGHLAIALMELRERSPASSATRADIDAQIKESVAAILDRQEPNGGWAYGYSGVRSYVYSAGGRSSTEFPDRFYTIDAAVPGAALAIADGVWPDAALRDAAWRALGFLEDHVGRVEWEGRRLWRLFPADEKTQDQGSAVNYELWCGFFFATLLQTAGPDAEERLRGYLRDALGYAEGHTTTAGDIAYGDYVDELRTSYAAWDAMLLAEMGRRSGMPEATSLARSITRRLGALILPSGFLPNVADYQESIPGAQRWRVHRHGVGPFPLRVTYQTYLIIACALAGESKLAARRALGFVLTRLYDPVSGAVAVGTRGGSGEFDTAPGAFANPGNLPWILHAVASLPALGAGRYVLDRSAVAPLHERLAAAAVAQRDLLGNRRSKLDAAEQAWLARGEEDLWIAMGGEEAPRERAKPPVDPADHAMACLDATQGVPTDGPRNLVARDLHRDLRLLARRVDRRGRMYGDDERSAEVAPESALAYSLAMARAGAHVHDDRLIEAGALALRYVTHVYRLPSGAIGASHSEPPVPSAGVRLFAALAGWARLAAAESR